MQFVELDAKTGEPLGKLTVLKEWELGEKGILEQFVKQTPITDPYDFAFIPVGTNLNFEHNFLLAKTKSHKLAPIDILTHPFIDLKPFLVLMNGGMFRGAGLDRMTNKPHDGRIVPEWYRNTEYDKILQYVNQEAREFVRLLQFLQREMPLLHERYRKAIG